MIDTIFSQLLTNQEYFGKVWPYMQPEYFDYGAPRTMFNLIAKHVENFNSVPTQTALSIAAEKAQISEVELGSTKELINSINSAPEDLAWLVKTTEEFIKEKAVYNATEKIIEIQANAALPPEKQDKRVPGRDAIPEIMAKAVQVGFDHDIGHDYFADYEKRWLYYQNKADKIPFNLEVLNIITKGGAERGTLNILQAGVNVGKSLGLCSLAADYLMSGYNVLYISMEMKEEVCAKRIDANLLDVSLDDIDGGNLTYAEFKAKMERNRGKTVGNLKMKQYPTGGANANTFRALLKEYQLKENFVPDIIIIDYLGICGSTRVRNSENTYILVKAIAEELRGLAVETNTIMWSAAQTQRSSWDKSDMEMADVAESAGLPATADFMLGVLETEQLAEMGCQLLVQIKSRYGDKNYMKRITIGVKKGNQRWIQTDQTTMGDKPITLSEAEGKMVRQAEGTVRSKLDQLADEALADFNF